MKITMMYSTGLEKEVNTLVHHKSFAIVVRK